MTEWRCFAPAKLNLYLHITGRRADGFHELDGLVAFATVGDMLTVTAADETHLAIGGPFAASLGGDPQSNLVWRAAEALASRLGIAAGAAIHLTKNLPVASGIGGGSSDAAAGLRALAALWRCDDPSMLLAIAAALGSDIPACLLARALWFGGVGDRIDSADPLPACAVVLVNPGIALPTASVYRGFHGPFSPASRFAIPRDARGLADLLAARGNDLTATAVGLVPAIGAVLAALEDTDACLLARMSGSGATCFGLFATLDEAEAATRGLRVAHPDWWIAAARLDDGGPVSAGP